MPKFSCPTWCTIGRSHWYSKTTEWEKLKKKVLYVFAIRNLKNCTRIIFAGCRDCFILSYKEWCSLKYIFNSYKNVLWNIFSILAAVFLGRKAIEYKGIVGVVPTTFKSLIYVCIIILESNQIPL